MTGNEFNDSIREARRKELARKERRPVDLSRVPKRKLRDDTRPDGQPSTDALERWGPADYLSEFTYVAKQTVPDYTPAVIRHEIKSMKNFLDTLEANEACPRSQLDIVREAARRLIRYKKEFNLSTAPGVWWLLTYCVPILEDLRHLIYSQGTLRYLMSEEVPSDMIHVTKVGECWVFSYEGAQVQVHVSQLSTVQNPYLATRLGKALTEERPDNENFSGWES